MDNPIVPAWLVALIVFSAAGALWSVRPMPRAIRLSLIAPLLYLAGLFTFFQFTDMSGVDRVDFSRAGICLIGLAIIVNGVAVRYIWSREHWL
jgi:drug/metabolite transporter superfamily protein YnfA